MREPDLRKVTIIGAGNVGATIAYTLAIEGIANEILMIDIKADKAEGEAMDITQGSPFFKGTLVTSGDYKDAVVSLFYHFRIPATPFACQGAVISYVLRHED